MRTFLTFVFLTLAVAGVAFATDITPVPEIDGGAAVSALAVLAGALVVIRGRRKQ